MRESEAASEGVATGGRPLRILLRWRALGELKSHAELFKTAARILNAEALVLSAAPIAWFEDAPNIRTLPASERARFHPTMVSLSGWKGPAEEFAPDLLLALDEAYCRSTFQLVRWAADRGIPSAFLSCQNIDRPLPIPFRWLESKTLQRVRGGWFLNDAARARAVARGFRGVGETIPLAVDPSDFPRVDDDSPAPIRTAPDGPFTVGYAGRLVPEKGVSTLIGAAARAGDRLLIAGEGPLRRQLEREAESLGVRAEWLGAVPSDRIPAIYDRMDALVLPSRETPKWREQFGRVLIEAMAAGVPVVGSDSGEIPAVIDDAGLLFPSGDAAALAGCLIRLREEEGLRESLVAKGLDRVRTRFTNPIVADRIAGWIRRILENADPVS